MPDIDHRQTIQDLGERIGGARKDTAESGYKMSRRKSDDTRPAWARRFKVMQIMRAPGQLNAVANEGKWIVRDERTTDWRGIPKQIGSPHDTKEAAEATIPLAAVSLKHRAIRLREGIYEISRDISDRKRVRVVEQTFPTREAALIYMADHAVEIVETNTTFGEADLPLPPDRARIGPARRVGDVTGGDFMRTFGLRGVEFGNWNNQLERQALLNDSYDALVDLAEVLKVEPKALSLDGSLALAFGARGHGLSSARAHYEPERTVMNLTKERGAGSLAHEWFHALDHYLGRIDGKASSAWKAMNDRTRTLDVLPDGLSFATAGFSRSSRLPAAVREALDGWQRAMTTKPESYTVDLARIESFVATTHEELKYKLDQLRSDLASSLDVRYYKRNNKPASAEQLAHFDAIAQSILSADAKGICVEWRGFDGARGATFRNTNDAAERLSAIYKEVRGRSGFDSQHRRGVIDTIVSKMHYHGERLQQLEKARAESTQVRMAPTEYAMSARELDQGRGTNYWTQPTEICARAFQAWVEDRLRDAGGMSRFLNHAPENFVLLTPWGTSRPYPAGEERVRINAAFDRVALAMRQAHIGNDRHTNALLCPREESTPSDQNLEGGGVEKDEELRDRGVFERMR